MIGEATKDHFDALAKKHRHLVFSPLRFLVVFHFLMLGSTAGPPYIGQSSLDPRTSRRLTRAEMGLLSCLHRRGWRGDFGLAGVYFMEEGGEKGFKVNLGHGSR